MLVFFFFKQKTAYEMRISDWSSDVCSSDLREARDQAQFRLGKNQLLATGRRVCDATENLVVFGRGLRFLDADGRRGAAARRGDVAELAEIGSASCRERVCQSV